MTEKPMFARCPSGTRSCVVYVSSGALWAVGEDAPRRIDHGDGALITALGDPDSEEVLFVVDDGQYVLRRVDLTTLARRELCRSSHVLDPIGWLGERELLLAEQHPGEVRGSTLVEVTAAGAVTQSALTRITHVDRFDEDRVIAGWGVTHPAEQRDYRGGGRGRIMVGTAEKLDDVAIGASNPANPCVIGDRIYFLDDSTADRSCQVFSVALDGTGRARPRCHTFNLGGVTSLRRGAGHLVIGAGGGVWRLDVDSGTLDSVPTPAVPGDRQGVPAAVDCIRQSAAGDAIAVLGEGTLDVLGTPTPGHDVFVIDAGWKDSETLIVLSSTASGLQLREHVRGGAVHIEMPRDNDRPFGGIQVAADTLVLFGEFEGVYARTSQRAWAFLGDPGIVRHSRPTVSADGHLVAWAGQDMDGTAMVVVTDVETGELGVLHAAGSRVRAVTFIDGHTLAFALQRHDPWTGSVAPLRENDTICAVDAKAVMREGNRAPLRRLGAGVPGTQSIVRAPGALLAASGSRVVAIDDATYAIPAGRFIGDAQTPAFQQQDRVVIVRARGEVTVDITRSEVSPELTLSEVRRLVVASSGCVSPMRDAEELADVRESIRGIVRELGVSHAMIVPPASAVTSDASLATSHSGGLRDRAAAALAGVAEYICLPDVGAGAVRRLEGLTRRWSGTHPLVLDLRGNEGGPFAEYLAALVRALLDRSLAYVTSQHRELVLSAPEYVNILVDETTGSGGEHLAAILRAHPRAVVLGRQTVGAGTGFHSARRVAGGTLVLPQYRIEREPGSESIENWGVVPAARAAHRHDAGDRADEALLAMLPLPPVAERLGRGHCAVPRPKTEPTKERESSCSIH